MQIAESNTEGITKKRNYDKKLHPNCDTKPET